MFEVTVEIREPGWECDEYGTPEYEAGAIKVPTILAIKAAQDGSLKLAKDTCEAAYPKGPVGREYVKFIGDEAMLGRLYALEWERVEHIQSNPSLVRIQIVGVRRISSTGKAIVVPA